MPTFAPVEKPRPEPHTNYCRIFLSQCLDLLCHRVLSTQQASTVPSPWSAAELAIGVCPQEPAV